MPNFSSGAQDARTTKIKEQRAIFFIDTLLAETKIEI
jgi:hypothetical protein